MERVCVPAAGKGKLFHKRTWEVRVHVENNYIGSLGGITHST